MVGPLGIRPELIEPAHPEQNGRHERMHKTLKAETARPPRRTLAAQQRRFDWFRHRYNDERPHEALGQRLPASLYHASPRPYPATLLPITYPGHYEVRRVSRNGGIRWGSRWVNVSHVLAELDVGFEEIDDGLWEVYFGPVWLGRLHETTCRIVDHLGPRRPPRRREPQRGSVTYQLITNCYLSPELFTARQRPVNEADDEPDHRKLEQVIHALEGDPGAERRDLVLASLCQNRIAPHEHAEQQAERGPCHERASTAVEEGVQVGDDSGLQYHRQNAQGDDRPGSREDAESGISVFEESQVPATGDGEGQQEVT